MFSKKRYCSARILCQVLGLISAMAWTKKLSCVLKGNYGQVSKVKDNDIRPFAFLMKQNYRGEFRGLNVDLTLNES